MSGFQSDPIRWKDLQDQAGLAEREAGRAIRFMPTSEPLPAAQLTRIAVHIRAAGRRRKTRWLTVTAGLILTGATLAFAAHLIVPGWVTRIVNPRQVETAPRKRAALGPNTPISPNTALGLPAPVETNPDSIPSVDGQAVAPQAPRKPMRRAADKGRRVAWLDEGNPAPDTGDEQGMAKYLSEAVHALRVEHSPGAALTLLDRHAARLGQSAFAHEALLLRVEAMLALHRKDEVLQLLDGMALTDVAASRSLRVTRGELRATAGRCAEGLGDFDWVLAKSKQADRQALFGRALCRKKLGDSVGAQADVERYRREFPSDLRLRDLER